MKRRILAIVAAASWMLVFQTQDAQARSYPLLLDNVLKGAVDVVDQTVGGVSDSVNQTVNGATNVLEQTVNGTLNQTEQVVRDTLDVTGQAAGGLLEPITSPTANSVGHVVDTVEQVVKDANVIVNESVDIPLNTLPQATGALNGKAADPIGTLLEETGQTVKSVDRTVKNATGNVGQIVESVGAVTEGTGSTVGGVVEVVTDTVKETIKPITQPGSGTPSVPVIPVTPIAPKPPLPEKERDQGNAQEPEAGQAPALPVNSGTNGAEPIRSSGGTPGDAQTGGTPANARPDDQAATRAGEVVRVEEAPPTESRASTPALPEEEPPKAGETDAEPEQSLTPAGYERADAGEISTIGQPIDLISEALQDPVTPDERRFFPNEEVSAAPAVSDEPSRTPARESGSAGASSELGQAKPNKSAPLAPREGRQPQPSAVPALLSESATTRGTSGSLQGGSGFAGPQLPIAQLYAGFMPRFSDSLYRLKTTSDTEGSQWINAPPFSPPKQAPFLT